MRLAVLLTITAGSLFAQILRPAPPDIMDRADLMKIRNAAAASLRTDGDYAALIVLAHEMGHAVAHRLADREISADRRELAAHSRMQ